jgi:putative oxidoreductase
MRHITIEEPPPLSLTLAMTLLRSVAAIAVMAYGWQNWQHLAHWQQQLARYGILTPEVVPRWALGAVLLFGFGLTLGWATRLWSFGLLCAEIAFLATAYTAGSLRVGTFEYPLLLAAVALLLVITGGGRISVDHALFERARRRAIEADERWSLHPYVPASEQAWPSAAAPRWQSTERVP